MKIMVVVAHPDDEVLGCGGTIARHIRQEDEVSVLVLGEGITSRNLNKKNEKKELCKLHDQLYKASKLLGFRKIIYAFPDNRFDTTPLLDIVKVIELEIRKFNPEMIYTHWEHDLNIDHQITFKAVMTATRPIGSPVKKILSFEVPSSTEWNFTKTFRPNHYIELTEEELEVKNKALKLYEGEMRKYPHPRSEEAIITLAMKRGIEVGLKYAEAFKTIREVV